MDHARSTAEERLEQLSAWLDGELDEAEQATVASHIEDCDECQRVLADLHAVRALLRTLPAPVLPRSFELPDEVLANPTLVAAAGPPFSPTADTRARGDEDLVVPMDGRVDERAVAFVAPALSLTRYPRRTPRWVRVVQQVGGMAAIIGLVLLLSSALLNSPAHYAAPLPAKAPASASHGTANQSAASTATSPSFGAVNPITSTRAPASNAVPGETFGLPGSQPPLLVVIGLTLIALGIVLIVGGLLVRRRYRGLAPRATAPPGAQG